MDSKITILYIGNSSEIISHLQSCDEIQLIEKTNALEADKYLASFPKPDAIFSDCYLPGGGNGVEFYNQLRENAEFDSIAFILLTHEFKEELFKTAFNKGIEDFYVLPLPPADGLAKRVSFLKEFHRKYPSSPPDPGLQIKYKMPLSKRIFDVFMACFALLLLSPILLLVIIAIRIESKGKVYYTSKRVGREPFNFYKLRSMRTGAADELAKLAKEKNQYNIPQKKSEQKSEGTKTKIDYSIPCPKCTNLPRDKRCSTVLYKDGTNICEYWYRTQLKELDQSPFIKISNDPRITRVGKFIRNTSIDELPQLINVLKN